MAFCANKLRTLSLVNLISLTPTYSKQRSKATLATITDMPDMFNLRASKTFTVAILLDRSTAE